LTRLYLPSVALPAEVSIASVQRLIRSARPHCKGEVKMASHRVAHWLQTYPFAASQLLRLDQS
jgi:hypothetical protein